MEYNQKNVKNALYNFKKFIELNESLHFLNSYYEKLVFGSFSPVCTFATENIDSYLSSINVVKKKCLTVTSSGDHLINLAFHGAESVDCFDINIISKYFTKLKLAALKVLDYKEFINFFAYNNAEVPCYAVIYFINNEYFKYKTYLKFSNNLDIETRIFFDEMFRYFNYDGLAIRESKLFYNFSDDRAIHNNSYLKNEKNYYKAREEVERVLKNGIKYFVSDVFEIFLLKESYDVIFLSNIYDYTGEKKEIFTNYIDNILKNIVTDNGLVLVNYQYGYRQRKSGKFINNLAVYVSEDDNRYFNITNIENLSGRGYLMYGVPSVYENQREIGVEDCVYIYKKR